MLKLKLGKLPIYLRFSFLLCISLFLLLEQLEIGRKMLLALLIHELGHLLILMIQGQELDSMELSATGIAIQRRGQGTGFFGELLLHLAGPLANLMAMGLLWERDKFACAFHLILAVVNLLPIVPLDGGSITELLLEQFLPPNTALRMSRRISVTALLVLFIVALPLAFGGRNPALLLFVLMLVFRKSS